MLLNLLIFSHFLCFIFTNYKKIFWAFRLSAFLRFWLIIVLSFYNAMLLLYLCNILLYLIISSLSTLRFGPRWANVPWTFSASQLPLNPSRPCQVSHSHATSPHGVSTTCTPSQYFRTMGTCPRSTSAPPDILWRLKPLSLLQDWLAYRKYKSCGLRHSG